MDSIIDQDWAYFSRHAVKMPKIHLKLEPKETMRQLQKDSGSKEIPFRIDSRFVWPY